VAERGAAARILVGLRQAEKGLALVPAQEAAALSYRVHALLEAQDVDGAEALLAPALARGPDVRESFLDAMIAVFRGDEARAARALKAVAKALPGLSDRVVALESAYAAGVAASDLSRYDEALAFFRHGFGLARTERERADFRVDLALVLKNGGRLAEAERELSDALATYAALGDRDRYVSALGNRAEIALERGDLAAAGRDVAVVLAYDRKPGRERQFLYGVPARQRLALFAGDATAARAAFAELERSRRATKGTRRFARRSFWRRVAVCCGEAAMALRLLEEAGALPTTARRRSRSGALLASALSTWGARRRTKRSAPMRRASSRPSGRSSAAGGFRETPSRCSRRVRRALRLRPRRSSGCWSGVRGSTRSLSTPNCVASDARQFAPPDSRPSRPRFPKSPKLERTCCRRQRAVEVDRGRGRGTKEALATLHKVVPTNVSVAILGETGSGKEVFAQELHRASKRKGKFIAVNIVSVTGTLFESELFGHVRGAFSGADRDRIGLVEESSGGTLFLDEIGDLPLPAQAKLLRVLQEHEVRRVGEAKTRKVDLRVVTATHRDLASMIKTKEFREDLWHRLNSVVVTLPPPGNVRATSRSCSRGCSRVTPFRGKPGASSSLTAGRGTSASCGRRSRPRGSSRERIRSLRRICPHLCVESSRRSP
jgi:tetratricopeptide (TPR) repeat protein